MLKFISVPLFLLVGLIASAQTRQLSGVVRDQSTGTAVPAATVTVKGTSRATTTNTAGEFQFNVPSGAVVLQISSAGYASTEVDVQAGSNYHFAELFGALHQVYRYVVGSCLHVNFR